MKMDVRTGLGQDTHQFVAEGNTKPLVMAGVTFAGERGLEANSDGDVVLHAVTRALDSILGTHYLGKYADDWCAKGISDSVKYIEPAIVDLKKEKFVVTSISITLECLKPKIMPKVPAMKKRLGEIFDIGENRIGFTCESGDGLTDFAQGKGIRCLALVTVVRE